MIDLDDVSRLVLAVTCWVSAAVAFAMAVDRRTPSTLVPHLLLLVPASLAAGWGMASLAFPSWWPTPFDGWFVRSLNVSFALTVGGWAALGWRLLHRSRQIGRSS